MNADTPNSVGPTDFTDPRTVDVSEVMANITFRYRGQGDFWTDQPVWPNVTVMALTAQIVRLRTALAQLNAICRNPPTNDHALALLHAQEAIKEALSDD